MAQAIESVVDAITFRVTRHHMGGDLGGAQTPREQLLELTLRPRPLLGPQV